MSASTLIQGSAVLREQPRIEVRRCVCGVPRDMPLVGNLRVLLVGISRRYEGCRQLPRVRNRCRRVESTVEHPDRRRLELLSDPGVGGTTRCGGISGYAAV